MISTITAIGGIISLIIMIFLLSRGLYFLKNNDHKSFNKNSDIIKQIVETVWHMLPNILSSYHSDHTGLSKQFHELLNINNPIL